MTSTQPPVDPMPTPAALAGEYRLCPGQSPAIEGRRPVLAPGQLRQWLRGQSPEQVVRTLGNLFTLCAHAHQRTARLALKAAHASLTAIDARSASPTEPAALLLVETARDHLRSIALDWPQRLGLPLAPAQQLAWLKGCPLPIVAATPVTDEALAWRLLAQLNGWLASRVLLQSTETWLAQHGTSKTLADWCQARVDSLLPACCLADGLQHAAALTHAAPKLDLLDPDPALQRGRLLELVQQIQREPDFCQYPTWHGRCAENGPWTRLRHRANATSIANSTSTPAPATIPINLSQRLASRWFELLELSQATPAVLANTPAPLISGVLVTGPGQALAWCEMARGLLLHWAHCAACGSVIDYKVMAPTEWNFHPQGTLAGALAALSPTDTAAAYRLAAAFDPCVACTV